MTRWPSFASMPRWSWPCLLALIAAPVEARQTEAESTAPRSLWERVERAPTRMQPVSLLNGGDFEEPGWAGGRLLGSSVPHWRSLDDGGLSAEVQRDPNGDGRVLVFTRPGALSQPIALDPASGASASVAGRARGPISVRWTDGSGDTAEWALPGGNGWSSFDFDAEDFAAQVGHAPRPRFVLEIVGRGAGAAVDDLQFAGELPHVDPADLRAEVRGTLDAILLQWARSGLDNYGPRSTTFCTQRFDVVTGAGVDRPYQGSVHVLFETLLEACSVTDEPAWEALLNAHIEDLLELGIHPESGLPRLWDAEADEPLDRRSIEIARTLRFLLAVADRGPEGQRERALAAAVRMGEAVLEHGRLPTGEVAASYRPEDGQPATNVSRLRRLDVPAELVVLSERTGDARFAQAAKEALSAFEFLHHWAGTWNSIDPGFDDDYGHFGARSATMGLAAPDDPYFARLALTGADYFLPTWEKTLRFGGFVAADQTRSWRVLADCVRLEPERLPQVRDALELAIDAHFKGEQTTDGSWVDVSHQRFDPKLKLEVGDLPGPPANLLRGLALCRRTDLGIDRDFLNARFLTVLRSTIEAYGRDYGLRPTLPEARGANPSGASLRIASELAEWLLHP